MRRIDATSLDMEDPILRHVLVVDDEESIRLMVTSILEDEGYAVTSGMDGDALRAALESPPDLILLDIMMPIMDGPEVRQHLLEDPRTADVPVVVMTAAGDASIWARRLSAAGYVQKPFDINVLLDLVERLVAPAE